MERQPADTRPTCMRLLEMDTIEAHLGAVQQKQAHRSVSMRTER